MHSLSIAGVFVAFSVTALSSAVLPRQGVTPPAECPIPTWTVTTFNWFNSSDNLDCFSGPDLALTGCWNSSDSGPPVWCDSDTGPCQNCGIALCETGFPPQPIGFGPPDTINIDVENGNQCSDINPKGYRRHDLGNGEVECGTAASIMEFYGTSLAGANQGHIDYHPVDILYPCTNGSYIQGAGTVDFTFDCSVDAGGNATCTADPFVIPLLSWTIQTFN